MSAPVCYKVSHSTIYHYDSPVGDSYGHLRMTPAQRDDQESSAHRLHISGHAHISQHTDYFGNTVHVFSIPGRHKSLKITSEFTVKKYATIVPNVVTSTSVAEARQILGRQFRLRFHDFIHSTALVPTGAAFATYVKKFLQPARPIGDALNALNEFIHQRFSYVSGKTSVETRADEVARKKRGVCQDFAHFMLGTLRTARLPARYVSGYIETTTAKEAVLSGRPELVGSAATHAWVEVLLPGGFWLGLDPTNNLIAGDRHIIIGVGRDYGDVAPLKGRYRGTAGSTLDVCVRVIRKIGRG